MANLQLDNNVLTVSGEMTSKTVMHLLAQSKTFFQGQESLNVDLSHVDHADSAGLALLCHWYKLAMSANVKLNFTAVPKQLLNMAKLCGVKTLLPFSEQQTLN